MQLLMLQLQRLQRVEPAADGRELLPRTGLSFERKGGCRKADQRTDGRMEDRMNGSLSIEHTPTHTRWRRKCLSFRPQTNRRAGGIWRRAGPTDVPRRDRESVGGTDHHRRRTSLRSVERRATQPTVENESMACSPVVWGEGGWRPVTAVRRGRFAVAAAVALLL